MICYTCGHQHGFDDECIGTFSGKQCPSCGETEIPDERETCYACAINDEEEPPRWGRRDNNPGY